MNTHTNKKCTLLRVPFLFTVICAVNRLFDNLIIAEKALLSFGDSSAFVCANVLKGSAVFWIAPLTMPWYNINK